MKNSKFSFFEISVSFFNDNRTICNICSLKFPHQLNRSARLLINIFFQSPHRHKTVIRYFSTLHIPIDRMHKKRWKFAILIIVIVKHCIEPRVDRFFYKKFIYLFIFMWNFNSFMVASHALLFFLLLFYLRHLQRALWCPEETKETRFQSK